MKILLNLYIITGYLFLFCFSGLSLAQAPAGLSGQFLRHGMGGTALGMGRAFTGQADDASAPYWNPAGLPSIGQFELTTSAIYLHNDVRFFHFGICAPIDSGQKYAFGLNTLLLNTTGIERWYYQGTAIKKGDENFDWNESALLLSFAARLRTRYPVIELGATIPKIVYRSLDRIQRGVIASDLGLRVSWRWFDKPASFGMQLQNLPLSDLLDHIHHTTIGYDTLNYTFNAGISTRFHVPVPGWCLQCFRSFFDGDWTFNADASFIKRNEKWSWERAYCEGRFGFARSWPNSVAFRTGLSVNADDVRCTVGLGVDFSLFKGSVQLNSALGLFENLGYKGYATPVTSIDYRDHPNCEFLLQKAGEQYAENDTSSVYYFLYQAIDKDWTDSTAIKARLLFGDMEYNAGKYEQAIQKYLKVEQIAGTDEKFKMFYSGHAFDKGKMYYSYLNYLECTVYKYFADYFNAVLTNSKPKFELKYEIGINPPSSSYGTTLPDSAELRYNFSRTLLELIEKFESITKGNDEKTIDSALAICERYLENKDLHEWQRSFIYLNRVMLLSLKKHFDESFLESLLLSSRMDSVRSSDAKYLKDFKYSNINKGLMTKFFEQLKDSKDDILAKLLVRNMFLYPENSFIKYARKQLPEFVNLIKPDNATNSLQIDLSNTPKLDSVGTPVENLYFPFKVTVGNTQKIYISEPLKHRIVVYDERDSRTWSSRDSLTVKSNNSDFFPYDLAVDKFSSAGNPDQEILYASDWRSGKVWAFSGKDKWDEVTKFQLEKSNPNLREPVYLTSGLARNSVFACTENFSKIGNIMISGDTLNTPYIEKLSSRFCGAVSIYSLPEGKDKFLYVSDMENYRVWKYDFSEKDTTTLYETPFSVTLSDNDSSLFVPIDLDVVIADVLKFDIFIVYAKLNEPESRLLVRHRYNSGDSETSNEPDIYKLPNNISSISLYKGKQKLFLYALEQSESGKLIKYELPQN